MRKPWQPAALACALALFAFSAYAQPVSELQLHIRYNSGQEVVPIFEGWERVPDGSFNMVFGYLNRNHVEEVSVPVGPQNGFEPGPADRGQPGYFYTRENHFQFRVSVPADWSKTRELVWTVTANGKTERARATLLDIWEIDRKTEVANLGVAGGTSSSNAAIMSDKPPDVAVGPAQRAVVGAPIVLTAKVEDDGLPGPSPPRITRKPEPAMQGAPPSPVNVPMPQKPRPPQGLSVLWMVYRGPGGVEFDPAGYVPVKEGKADVKAVFSRPGAYTIRAVGFDGLLRTPADVTVTVAEAPVSPGQQR